MRTSESPVDRHQRFARHLHVFVVVDGEVGAVAGAGAERRHAQDVGDEVEALAVPGEDHRAGAGEARRFLDGAALAGAHGGLVLDQAVRPGDAHGVGGVAAAEAEVQRHAGVTALLVAAAGLHLDLRSRRQQQVLDPAQTEAQPLAGARGLVGEQADGAAGEERQVDAAVGVEVGGDEIVDSRRGAARSRGGRQRRRAGERIAALAEEQRARHHQVESAARLGVGEGERGTRGRGRRERAPARFELPLLALVEEPQGLATGIGGDVRPPVAVDVDGGESPRTRRQGR